MFNKIEKVEAAIGSVSERIRSQSDEVKYLNNHLFEHKRDMDHPGDEKTEKLLLS